jgi:hypothetical protein
MLLDHPFAGFNSATGVGSDQIIENIENKISINPLKTSTMPLHLGPTVRSMLERCESQPHLQCIVLLVNGPW